MNQMEIEGEHPMYPIHGFGDRGTALSDQELSQLAVHNLSFEEERVLKRKQEKNILVKIEKIVEKIVPIHEAEY